MGTRGVWGFYKKGINKLTYNHFDSYPSHLGLKMVEFVQSTSIEDLNNIFGRIILIDESVKPTKNQIKECKKYSDLKVSNQSIFDWYCLLRNAQGCPELYKSDLRYMLNYNNFIKESLFCEWAYVINLSENILEIYSGFRDKPNSKENRYKILEPKEDYYACEKLIDFRLNEIPDNWQEQTLREYKSNY